MVGSETWCRYGTRYARCADDSSRLDELAQHQRKRGKTGDFRGCITAIRSSQLTTFQCRAPLKARDLQVTGRRDRERDALHVIRVCASVLSELWSNLGDRQRLLLYYTKRKKKKNQKINRTDKKRATARFLRQLYSWWFAKPLPLPEVLLWKLPICLEKKRKVAVEIDETNTRRHIPVAGKLPADGNRGYYRRKNF